jgi:hypothetical protein
VDAADLIVFQVIDKINRNSNFRFLLEATPYYRNIFTFTLFLPERRTGVAWEPSNKMMLFLPPRKIKCFSLHPLISSLNLLFNLSFMSLSLGFEFKSLILCSSLCLGLHSLDRNYFSSLVLLRMLFSVYMQTLNKVLGWILHKTIHKLHLEYVRQPITRRVQACVQSKLVNSV